MGTATQSQTTAAEPSGDPRLTTQVNPWARGGSMSVDWEPASRRTTTSTRSTPGTRSTPDEASGDGTNIEGGVPSTEDRVAPAGRTVREVTAAVVAAIVLGATAVGLGIGLMRDRPAVDGRSQVEPEVTAAAAPVLARLDPPSDDADGRASISNASSETAVGTIAWVRIDGDTRSLPLRITPLERGELLGEADAANRWTSSDGGANWTRTSRVTIEREIGGVDWTLRIIEGDTSLWRASEGAGLRLADVELPVDAVEDADGYEVRSELPPDGFPISVAGDAFLPVTVRAELPWTDILGTSVGRPFRVEVDVGGRPVRAVSGDFHELSVTRLELRDLDSGRFELRDADDVVVWSFSAPSGGLGLSPADVISGAPRTLWTRWDGDRFRVTDAPWGERDRTEVVAAGEGALARAVGPGREVRLWRTGDGVDWAEVDLPLEPTDGTPLTIHRGHDEVIVTAYTERGAVAWATADGLAFHELAGVPGVESRTRGSFGWVAPPPRSEPQVHVSPDGDRWELVDLRAMLGMDDAQWGVNITAAAIGSEIYVVADGPLGRTLLIGTVGITRCAGFDERCAVDGRPGDGE